VVVQVDPKMVDFSIVPAFTQDQKWTLARVERDVTVALDAGQFRRTLPFGWVLSRGHEVLSPEYAPLAGAVVVTHSGAVRIVAPDSVALERSRETALDAFQSYPMLLQNGAVPPPLQHPGNGVDLDHRDARLALGTLADGSVIIALTRFDALGPSLGRVPFGLTTPEMAALMGALGCREALSLDGGISGQLLLRDADGSARSWSGIRAVPLGLVGRPRKGARIRSFMYH
jgi:exopolysaccharide biosynthesis protein